jgi:hypothetical protein
VPAFIALLGLAGLVSLRFRSSTVFASEQKLIFQASICLILLVAIAFAGFIWTFFQAQGRYLYPAVGPICVLLSLGIRTLVPEGKRDLASVVLLVALAAVCALFLFGTTIPAYSPR